MNRSKIALTVLTTLVALFVVGMTQSQPAKEAKEPKEKKGDPIKTPAEPDTFKDDLRIVRERGLKGDGPDILEYFKERTLKAPDPKIITALVKQLGDEDFATREAAFTKLVGLGASALAGLKEGENDPDLEVKKRVNDLKQRIDTKAEPTLQVAAARVLAKLKPEGSVDVLMAFLPFASDPMVIDEICRTLGAVAVTKGEVAPVLLKSLEDPIAVKRGAAGEALARANVKDQLPNVKKLLKDKDVSVRFRVCMAMVTSQDKDIVPVMIDLLGEMSSNQLWPIEEALLRLAGDKAPNVALGNDEPGKKACRDAWAKWYGANEKTIDMAKLTQETLYLGYTLIVYHNNRIGGGGGNVGEIVELDKEKNVRWKFSIPQGYPVDAHMIGNNRVIVAEWQGAKVTERDLKGEIKWEHNCGGNPFAVQRLPNGNTFIAMQGRLVEVDRNKNEVWSYQRPNQDIQRAKKLPGGDVAMIVFNGNMNNSSYIRIDNKKNVVKTFNTNLNVQMMFGAMDVLPNGHVLIPHYQNARVGEYDDKGTQVGNALNLQWANSVVRLPNGNNLITSYNQRQVYEYNGNQQVWNHQVDGLVFVARRR